MPRLSRRRDAFAALALCLLAACRPSEPPAPSAAPLPGLALRIASDTPCLACETLPQRDPAARPLHLKRRPVVTAADIEAITLRTDPFSHMPTIDFTFRPEAHARIHDATATHAGELLGWVANGEVFHVTRLAGPFSGSMMVTGMDEDERDELFGLLTGVAPSPAPATPTP
jgi:preprotein translocase subunit SecD